MKLKTIMQYNNKVRYSENIYFFTQLPIKDKWKIGTFKLEFYE